MAKLLLIEDSIEAQFLVKRVLTPKHNLDVVTTASMAESMLKSRQFDLILLDRTLPDGDGIYLCKKLRDEGYLKSVPIIMLTGKGEVDQRIAGLDAGADDYVSKPFDPRELAARVESVLRRKEMNPDDTFQTPNLKIQYVDQKVYKKINGAWSPLDLTPIEFKILSVLARHMGEDVTRDQLLEHVWGKGIHLSARNIDTHVCKLRQKLDTEEIHIKSIRGVGYRFELTDVVPSKVELQAAAVAEANLPLPLGLTP